MQQIELDLTGEKKIRSLGGKDILSTDDIKDFTAATKRVLDLMRDGNWHTAEAIKLAAGVDGVPASEGLRRMRELRREYTIERRRTDNRNFEYRLINKA